MKNIITFLTAIITLGLISCGNNGWDNATKQNFTNTCALELSGQYDSLKISQYCKCALNQTMQRFPHQEDAINSGLKLHQQEEVLKCRAQFLTKE